MLQLRRGQLQEHGVALRHTPLATLDKAVPDLGLLPNLFEDEALQHLTHHEGHHGGEGVDGLDDCAHEQEGQLLLLAQLVEHNHQHVLATVHKAGADETRMAIEAAAEAHKEWAHWPWEDRAAVFLKAAELLAGPYRDILNASTMLGQSKTAHQAEIDAACELIDFWRFNPHYVRSMMEDAQPPVTGHRGGIHNSVTRAVLKPTHMIGGYAQQSYGFNYHGTVGSNRDEFVIVRKLDKVDWMDEPLDASASAAE